MWTKCIDRLKELIEVSKISFAKAAETINSEFGTKFTRNACIGKAGRSGILVPVESIKSGKRKRKRGNSNGEIIQQIKAKRIRPPTAESPSITDDQIPLEQRKTLFELTDKTCRWPVGSPSSKDFFFCGGDAVDGLPYCGPHCRRAYTQRDHTRSTWAKYYRAA